MNRIGPRIVPCGIPLITSVINVKHVIPPLYCRCASFGLTVQCPDSWCNDTLHIYAKLRFNATPYVAVMVVMKIMPYTNVRLESWRHKIVVGGLLIKTP